MNSNILLLSMPGGSEWLILMIAIVFVIICPVLAIVYYMQAQGLKRENALLSKQIQQLQNRP